MIFALVLLFIAVPIAELYVILQVGDAIGLMPTIAILVADSILGSMLLRSQGRSAWRRFQAATSEGRVPAREVLDGALVIFGGAFLLTPGFITDVLGLFLLLPPTRAVVRRTLVGYFSRRFVVSAVRGGMPGRGTPPGPGKHGYDVEGTAVDVDPPGLER